VHVRVAAHRHHRGVTHRPALDLFSRFVVCTVVIVTASCSQRAVVATDVIIDLTLTPMPPVVGGVTHAVLTLRDRAGQPVRGATLQVEARMSHPGMAPIIAVPVERVDGVYDAQLELTMSGDWIVGVTGTLPDGRTVHQQIETAGARP
jgi:hypothetical protein